MKKYYFLLLMMFILSACSGVPQEVHYVAKSEHWKAIYHSNTNEGLQLIYLGDGQGLGDLHINIEAANEALDLSDTRVNRDGKVIIPKKDTAKLFNDSASETMIQISWQSYEEILDIQE
ncbi:membrane lipoprotein lipid attachment site-containing protein [Lysinibacillus parviboronicapiens]|uniref:Lipoprotein n=1 Tax=Lysinibacillus parviboronicapiens TaxID=436516 RepID=A0ABV2PQ26_9BACI|nr:membrane lipoprotein lipid attachment site-containing protein [Lysinibacillus parviboronicapiens]